MSNAHLNLLVDTNVWLDYLLGRPRCKEALNFLGEAAAREDVIAVAPSIMKDVFFLVCTSLKEEVLADGGDRVSEQSGLAVKRIAWSSLASIQRLSIMLNQGFQEHLEAMTLRDEHNDYEDDLLLATAKSAKIDYLITNDKGLLSNKVVPALSPQAYLDMKQSKKS